MRRIAGRRLLFWITAAGLSAASAIVAGLWLYAGSYGLHVVFRHGGTYWIDVAPDSPRLSASMRIALRSAPDAVPGAFQWRTIARGFEVADLPVIADGQVVDRILLARIDPNHYRFIVRNASDGDKGLDQWMTDLGAALVVNGSYFARDGRPDTPFLSDGVLLGPRAYDAKAGAFVVTRTSVGVVDLATTDWRAAFNGADSAMVSYPMLVAGDSSRVSPASRWLANRSFVGQDGQGRIIIGTTADGFFSLERFARFLHEAPLGLTFALNLDGGPVASQAICLNGFNRRSYGRWEAQVNNNQVQLLTWPYGTVAMPVVLAVLPE